MSDFCWLMLTHLAHFFTCVDSCWVASDSCWLVLGSCRTRVEFVLTRVYLCWCSCIRIDLILFMSKEKWNKTEKDKKTLKKKITAMKVSSVKMRYQIQILWSLWSLRTKNKYRRCYSSSSDDEEKSAEYKVKRISNNEWCECSAKSVVGRCASK